MNASRLRRTAWFSAAAFAVGTIFVPSLHLVFHALPHDHLAGEIHYQYGPVPHDDDDPHHHHGDVAEHEQHRHDHHHHDEQPLDPHHGEGSAAHFSLALSDSAASAIVILPLLGLTASNVIALPAEGCVVPSHVSVQRFRGPPRA